MTVTEFKVQVEGGEPQVLLVNTGIYRDAAAAVPALLGLRLPFDVDIWTEFSRFRYRIRENEYGDLVVEHLVRPTPLSDFPVYGSREVEEK